MSAFGSNLTSWLHCEVSASNAKRTQRPDGWGSKVAKVPGLICIWQPVSFRTDTLDTRMSACHGPACPARCMSATSPRHTEGSRAAEARSAHAGSAVKSCCRSSAFPMRRTKWRRSARWFVPCRRLYPALAKKRRSEILGF